MENTVYKIIKLEKWCGLCKIHFFSARCNEGKAHYGHNQRHLVINSYFSVMTED